MWIYLDDDMLEMIEGSLLKMEKIIYDRAPSIKSSAPLFLRSEKDLDTIGFFYHEGILQSVDCDVVENGLCYLFGLILQNLHEANWVYKRQLPNDIIYGMQIKNRNCTVTLAPDYLRRFNLPDVLNGESPTLDEYMLEIIDLLRRGEDDFEAAISE